MNRKAFTLIELLAVIVILAIIALIATPIVLGIINDARENSKKRSAELVYTGVEYAYTNALFKEGNGNVVDSVSLETIDKYLKVENVVRHGFDPSDTEKSVLQIQTKDNVYCKVVKNTTEKTFDVSCGTDETYEDTTDVMNTKSIAYDVNNTPIQTGPQWYSWIGGTIGGSLPSDKTKTPSFTYLQQTGEWDENWNAIKAEVEANIYLGFDSEDGATVSDAYVCFAIGEPKKEYCLKGGDSGDVFESNTGILDGAFPSNCSLDGGDYYCNAAGLLVSAYSYGDVGVNDGSANCYVSGGGSFYCDVMY